MIDIIIQKIFGISQKSGWLQKVWANIELCITCVILGSLFVTFMFSIVGIVIGEL